MRCSNCGLCCIETEMLLAVKDIRRLEKKGFSKSSFAEIDNQGYAVLKNRDGYCVFYNRICVSFIPIRLADLFNRAHLLRCR